jgi:hypothetical protein
MKKCISTDQILMLIALPYFFGIGEARAQSPECERAIIQRYAIAETKDRYGNTSRREVDPTYFDTYGPDQHKYGNNKAILYRVYIASYDSTYDDTHPKTRISVKIFCVMNWSEKIIGIEYGGVW